MAVVLQVSAMQSDLKAFGKAAAKEFIQNPQRLSDLESQLAMAVAQAKRGDRSLRWSTEGEGGPIRTVASSAYRNYAAGQKRLVGEVSFLFKGSLDPADDNRFVITSGGTKVRLCWDNSEDDVFYHFDIHPDAPGHPLLHIQFDGAIGEVPRLHSIFAHPLDVLEFTLMEMFQKKWRDVWSNAKFTSAIRTFPVHQRKRLGALFAGYGNLVNSANPALIALLTAPCKPVDLYPA